MLAAASMLQPASRRLPLTRASLALAAGALVMLCAWRGVWWTDTELRLAPALALLWCALALEPWRLCESATGGGAPARGSGRASVFLGATVAIAAGLPLHAAALVHDARLGPLSTLQVLGPLALAWLAWAAAGLAARAAQGAAWHRVAAALALSLPLLELSLALGGAPQTGGASAWLQWLAACSPVQALCTLARGANAEATVVSSVLCASLLVARQSLAPSMRASAAPESR